ncbi:MAG: hypothetical protein RMX68_028730 [Aulosira sp. ZfuVER01]|nr:hypothetical protein [Aulosira sp. ZfuVER01]MDZ8002832.1 hypothetical protein [Aulosira sp. DedVER01a]MDZ8054349.1 hypothetical protein [Aulosira sp. ZfuCHP01]
MVLDVDGIHGKIKSKVLELGLKKFEESKDKVSEKLSEIIDTVFDSKLDSVSRVIGEAISLYENLLEQQEKVHQETVEDREADKAWISQKYQELEQTQNKIKSIITV